MIDIQHVSKTFEQRTACTFTAIDDVTLTIGRGEFVSLLGGRPAAANLRCRISSLAARAWIWP